MTPHLHGGAIGVGEGAAEDVRGQLAGDVSGIAWATPQGSLGEPMCGSHHLGWLVVSSAMVNWWFSVEIMADYHG